MTMETNINYTLVGAFVITLISVTIFIIIWLSSGFSFQHYTNYLIYMQESISGLTIDSPVEFNGVSVGTVTKIQLNHKNPQLVELYLKINSTTPVTQGTVATLTTRGVTGITYVALKDKSTDLRPLIASPGQPYPVIKTAPSFFLRIDTALNQLSNNLHEVTKSIQSVLDKENQQSIKLILSNLQEITHTLADNSQKMTELLENTASASKQLGPMLKSGMGTIRMIETQTLPATYQLLGNLNDITRNLTSVSVELKENPSVLIRGAAPSPLGPGETK
jgi:phospholipid/cholesterol/gamma-HCH transport system substrate-binding protein